VLAGGDDHGRDRAQLAAGEVQRGRVQQQQAGDQAGIVDRQPQRDQPPEAVPDDHGGIVAGAADGLRQGICLGGEPERSPVGRLADPRRVDLDDRRSGFKGGGQLR
jgi:hypothetical protein